MRRKFGKRRKNLGMLGGSEVLVSPLVLSSAGALSTVIGHLSTKKLTLTDRMTEGAWALP
jgi:hypothetical protein